MRLKTTSTIFPGGWRYPQLDLQGRLLKSFRSMGPYTEFIAGILAFRTQNRLARASLDEVDADVQNHLCGQCGNDPRHCLDGSKKNSPAGSLVRAAKRAANTVRTLHAGAGTLLDWLGDGMAAVPPQIAQTRADICSGRLSGKPCPHNVAGGSLGHVTAVIAGIIHEQMERKAGMNITVAGEDLLKTCSVCLCHLPLKVHVPMQTITTRMPEAMMDKFNQIAPPQCWMRSA